MNDCESAFIKDILEGLSPEDSWRKNFCVNSTRGLKTYMQSLEVQDALKDNGVSKRKADNVIADQYKAERPIIVSKGATVQYVADNTARIEAAKTTYKLLGLLKDNNIVVDNRSVTFNGDVTQLGRIVEEMKALQAKAVIDTTGEVL